MRLCTVQGCERKHRRNGYCALHSQRVSKHGDCNRRIKSLRERIESKIEKLDNGCWQWLGAKYSNYSRGYGYLQVKEAGKRRHLLAHRAAYEIFRGAIPIGLTLDHLCRNRSCVNPDHLEPVSAVENIKRAKTARLTCRRGHPYSEGKFYLWRGTRICLVCRSITNEIRSSPVPARNAA